MKLAKIIDNVDNLNAGIGSNPDPSMIASNVMRIASTIYTEYILPFAIFCILAYGIYGGILYATAYGSEEKATKGKNTILWAIIGGVIVGLSFVLVRYFASTLLGAGDADIKDNLPR